MGRHLPGVLDADQVSGQPRVAEIQLGGFDQPLADVGKVRRQLEQDVAGLQHRQPLSRRRVRHAGVGAQGGEIDQLTDPTRAQPHETSKVRQVANLSQPPHVAFDVGLEVVGQRLRRIEALVDDARIETAIEHLVHLAGRAGALSLGHGKRQQPQQRRPSRQ